MILCTHVCVCVCVCWNTSPTGILRFGIWYKALLSKTSPPLRTNTLTHTHACLISALVRLQFCLLPSTSLVNEGFGQAVTQSQQNEKETTVALIHSQCGSTAKLKHEPQSSLWYVGWQKNHVCFLSDILQHSAFPFFYDNNWIPLRPWWSVFVLHSHCVLF